MSEDQEKSTKPDMSANGIAERAAEIANRSSEEPLPELPVPLEGSHRMGRRMSRLASGRDRFAGLTEATRRTGEATRRTFVGARNAAGWLSGQVLAMAPRIKVRSQAELRAQFPDRDTEDIADALVDGAARATAAAGGAAGLAAVLPVLPAFPAEIAAETLVVVGVEIKLIAELHEVYGVPAPGSGAQRMTMYVAAWASRRGVAVVPGGILFAAGSPIARLLRRRLAARAGRSAFALGPLLTGAAAGAYLNARETRRLGRQIRRDLRGG
jgi:hypothetical protein